MSGMDKINTPLIGKENVVEIRRKKTQIIH